MNPPGCPRPGSAAAQFTQTLDGAGWGRLEFDELVPAALPSHDGDVPRQDAQRLGQHPAHRAVAATATINAAPRSPSQVPPTASHLTPGFTLIANRTRSRYGAPRNLPATATAGLDDPASATNAAKARSPRKPANQPCAVPAPVSAVPVFP